MQEVTINVGRRQIDGTLFFPENLSEKHPAALLIHGWISTQERMFSLAEGLTSKGYICLTIDLAGHGRSSGDIQTISRAEHMADTIAAYDFLANQPGVDAKQIGVSGSSYGAYLATFLTGQRGLSWLVLRVPALYPNEGEDLPATFFNRDDPSTRSIRENSIEAKSNNTLNTLSEFMGDVLVVESENDEQVPHQTIQNYLDAAYPNHLTHIVMKNTSHSLGTDEKRREFTNIVLDWLESL